MPTVLVDTAAWIALVNTRDGLHSRAEQTMAELRGRNVALIAHSNGISCPRVRIAHGFFVNKIKPLELAARASIRLALVGSSDGPSIAELAGLTKRYSTSSRRKLTATANAFSSTFASNKLTRRCPLDLHWR